ncbi:MAG: lysozyme [Pseudomonadota bacterium]
MRIGEAGLQLIKDFEGLELEAYQDIVGVWTIGYGHTDHAGPPEVTPGLTITEEEAEDILRNDLGQYENAVLRALPDRNLKQHEFDALVSLCFNIGPTAFATSTLAKRLNAGIFSGGDEGAEGAFKMWVKAGGETVPGLVRRRQAEWLLFSEGGQS